MARQSGFDPVSTYVSLKDGGTANLIEVTETFWEEVMSGNRDDAVGEGTRLMTANHWTENWDTWEVHPAGDEIVFLVSGKVDFTLEEGNGERVVELSSGTYGIVPRGTWHTAKVREPSTVMFITPGAGTQHRPL